MCAGYRFLEQAHRGRFVLGTSINRHHDTAERGFSFRGGVPASFVARSASGSRWSNATAFSMPLNPSFSRLGRPWTFVTTNLSVCRILLRMTRPTERQVGRAASDARACAARIQ
jgi:hypothetical protein